MAKILERKRRFRKRQGVSGMILVDLDWKAEAIDMTWSSFGFDRKFNLSDFCHANNVKRSLGAGRLHTLVRNGWIKPVKIQKRKTFDNNTYFLSEERWNNYVKRYGSIMDGPLRKHVMPEEKEVETKYIEVEKIKPTGFRDFYRGQI